MNKAELWQQHLREQRKEYSFAEVGKTITKRNVLGQLHSEKGPAVYTATYVCCYFNGKKHGYYADIFGTIIYFFNNVLIPPQYYLRPWEMTVDEIIKQPNTEVRRVGLEVYGWERLEKENQFTLIDSDPKTGAKLLKYAGLCGNDETEPVMLVKVINATPEPDGSKKQYYLQVPPDMRTCREAIAWTFYLNADEYNPQRET